MPIRLSITFCCFYPFFKALPVKSAILIFPRCILPHNLYRYQDKAWSISIPTCPLFIFTPRRRNPMKRHTYYPVKNLITLKAENNALFSQMVAVTGRVYHLCQPAETTVTATVTFMDVAEYLDLLDSLAELLHGINQFFKKQLGRPFFNRIPDYKQWRVKIVVAAALYQEASAL